MINHPSSRGGGRYCWSQHLTSVKDKAKDPLQTLKLNIPLSSVIVK